VGDGLSPKHFSFCGLGAFGETTHYRTQLLSKVHPHEEAKEAYLAKLSVHILKTLFSLLFSIIGKSTFAIKNCI